MSIKALQTFVAVYKEESITLAAKKLNLTQPAVSSMIKELENRYSVQLFERAGRGIRKTRAANQLYDYASHITALYSEMDSEFGIRQDHKRIRIGASISVGTCLMPPLIRRYVETYDVPMPYVKIDSSDIIEKMLLENNLDLAVIEGYLHSDQIMAEPLLKDHLVLICGREHPLASRKKVTLDDLRSEHFLVREKNSGTRELVESTLLLNDFVLHPTWESTDTTAIIQAVMANLGISILPERLLTEYFKRYTLVRLEIEGITFTRDYRLVYHQNKYLPEQVTQFMDFLKESLVPEFSL